MDEILKVINTWLEIEKKSLDEMKGFPIVEAYHRGAVAYLTKVGLLMQRHLPEVSTRPDDAEAVRCPICDNTDCKNLTGG